MMNDKSVNYSVNFMSLLFLLFLGLKLAGCIDWSWWWIFSPIWVPALLIGIITSIVIAVTMIKGNGKGKR